VTRKLNRHLEDDVLHQREVCLDQVSQFNRHRICTQRRPLASTCGPRSLRWLLCFAQSHRPTSFIVSRERTPDGFQQSEDRLGRQKPLAIFCDCRQVSQFGVDFRHLRNVSTSP
jgi:hypothetical protein